MWLKAWLRLLWGSLLLSPETWYTQGFICALKESLVLMAFDFNVIVPFLLSCCCFSFVLECGISYFGEFQHTPVNACLEASCDFGVLTGEECMSFYSTIFMPSFPHSQSCPSGVCTSFLSSVIREEARTATTWPPEWKTQSQKTNQNDHMDNSLV